MIESTGLIERDAEIAAEIVRIFGPDQRRLQNPLGILFTSKRQALACLRSLPAGIAFAELMKQAMASRRHDPDPHPVPIGSPSSWKLAAALARRLDAVVPAPLRVVAGAEFVDVLDGDEVWHGSASSAIIEEPDDRDVLEQAKGVAVHILSGVQDAVAEALRLPWPLDDSRHMALPETRIEGDSIQLWFGDSAAPALRLEPLQRTDFIE